MQSVVNTVKGGALKVAEYFTPLLKESRFRETGVLTPEEFVVAGDHLVHHCPTWQWAAGDANYSKSYLPPDKQFLITRNVPCYRRAKHMEYNSEQECVLDVEEGEEGWVDTHHFGLETGDSGTKNLEDEMGGLSVNDKVSKDVPENDDDDDEECEAADMEAAFEEGGLPDDNDDARVEVCTTAEEMTTSTGEVIQTRTYDLHITYDKYYQTPRLWLTGYDENRKTLSEEAMYQDISQDHAKKTITMEAHPHILGPPMPSVHPCRHAEVMKKILETVCENGGELGVHMYLIIFLKFVQAVIPTIEYDFTQTFSL